MPPTHASGLPLRTLPTPDDGCLADEDLDRVVGGLARPLHFPTALGRTRPGDAALLAGLVDESPR